MTKTPGFFSIEWGCWENHRPHRSWQHSMRFSGEGWTEEHSGVATSASYYEALGSRQKLACFKVLTNAMFITRILCLTTDLMERDPFCGWNGGKFHITHWKALFEYRFCSRAYTWDYTGYHVWYYEECSLPFGRVSVSNCTEKCTIISLTQTRSGIWLTWCYNSRICSNKRF